MADAAAAKPRKKGKGGMILMIVGALVVAGSGVAGGFYAASKVSAAPSGEHAEAPKAPEIQYFEVEKGFTSNLREPDRYVEIGLGVSTHGHEPVGEELKAHDIAIRSAVLGILAEQSVEQISTLAGKTRLQADLKIALNKMLKAKTGKAPVDDVYFTNFIVQ